MSEQRLELGEGLAVWAGEGEFALIVPDSAPLPFPGATQVRTRHLFPDEVLRKLLGCLSCYLAHGRLPSSPLERGEPELDPADPEQGPCFNLP